MVIAEILAILLPPLLEKAMEIHQHAVSGALSPDDVEIELERLKREIAALRLFDDSVQDRINKVT